MKISDGVRLTWQLAAQEAVTAGKPQIDPAQFLAGITKLDQILRDGQAEAVLPAEIDLKALRRELGRITGVLLRQGVDLKQLRHQMRQRVGQGDHQHLKGETIHRSDSLRTLFDQGLIIADGAGSDVLLLKHIFLAILDDPNLLGCQLLRESGHDLEDIAGRIRRGEGEEVEEGTPLLDNIGKDLTALARAGKLGPIVGRRDEVLQVIQALARKTKNSPVLVGEAGVGKTAVVELLAIRIAEGKDPHVLRDKRVIEISMGDLIAGAKHRGDLEMRLKQLIRECVIHPDIIVFMDELHALVRSGGLAGGVDPANLLKPPLARGKLRFIGATTVGEYARFIEPDMALERRFEKIIIKEPSAEETLQILEGIKPKLEDHHNVEFPHKALRAAVELSVRFDGDHQLPDKAIDLMDKAGARTRVPQLSIAPIGLAAGGFTARAVRPKVKRETAAAVLADKIGVPVEVITGHFDNNTGANLLGLEKYLNDRVIGQSGVSKRLSDRLITAHAGITEQRGPLGVFLFLGPTGVGKTEMAKALADYLFGSERAMIRLDMSEYMEAHSAAKLIGSPPGYVGHEEQGQLTGKLRARPYAVVLLDEIDKAHPRVFDIFLQVFDDARLTDTKGRIADARHAIFVLTSNVPPSRQPGFDAQWQLQSQTNALKALKHNFRPEFLNRIDEICFFHSLSLGDVKKIVRLRMEAMGQDFQSQYGKVFKFDEAVVEYLAKAGHSEEYGVRELNRALHKEVEGRLARLVIKGEIETWKGVSLSAEKDFLVIKPL